MTRKEFENELLKHFRVTTADVNAFKYKVDNGKIIGKEVIYYINDKHVATWSIDKGYIL